MPRAVVFDMDGLLLDTERMYGKAAFAACEALGYAMTDVLHRALIGATWAVNRLELERAFGADFPFDVYHLDVRARYIASCADGIALRPGVLELLGLLRERRIPIGVATSEVGEVATRNLSQTGLLDHVQVLVTRDLVRQGKPHPESYLTAAAGLGTDPADCLALEDSHHGARAAIAAGMATILVPDLVPATSEIAAQCLHVARDLHEVYEMLAPL